MSWCRLCRSWSRNRKRIFLSVLNIGNGEAQQTNSFKQSRFGNRERSGDWFPIKQAQRFNQLKVVRERMEIWWTFKSISLWLRCVTETTGWNCADPKEALN